MKVVIENYDPEWQKRFDELKREILSLDRSGLIKTIEHVGSTSVTGLGAKPIIDIMIGVEKPEMLDMLPAIFNVPGYIYRKEYEIQLPYRRYFNKTAEDKKIAHIHCVSFDHQFRTDDIIFRDYIRENAKAKEEYFKHKTELSMYDWETVNDYAEAKTEFILNMKAKAMKYFAEKTEDAEADALNDLMENTDEAFKTSNNINFRRYKKAFIIKYPAAQTILLNRIIGAGMHNYFNKKDIIYLNKYFESTEKYCIQITPYSKPIELDEKLISFGFNVTDYWIRSYRSTESLELKNSNAEVKEVSFSEADEFSEMISNVFTLPRSTKEIFKSTVGKDGWKNYFVVHKGKNIAAASVYLKGETAWFGMAGTLPEFRGSGAQNALIYKRLQAAKEAGCKRISVETAPEFNSNGKKNPSFYNLLKNGFIKLYNRNNYIKSV